MTEQETLIWNISKSDNLAFLEFFPAFRDRSAMIGAASSLDGNGVGFDVLTPAAFLAHYGTPPQPRLPMGPAVGAGAVLTNWTVNDSLYKEQQKSRVVLRKLWLDAVPQHLLVPMQDANRSLRMRTLEFMVTTLQEQLGTLTKADLDWLIKQVKEPYQQGTSISSFVANWKASLQDLERAGQGLPQSMATDILQNCFGPEFNPCWIRFVENFPLVANRTVERLIQTIITFARDSLPLLTAHSAIGISAVTDQTELIVKMQAQIDKLEFQALAASIENRKRGQGSVVDRPSKQSRETALAARPFCWSHGPKGHLGSACTSQLPGHKSDATWANQKGSKWKELFNRRGWSTA
jgi:hypothetical protein